MVYIFRTEVYWNVLNFIIVYIFYLLTLYDLGERISQFGQNSDFEIRRDHGKNSYNSRVNESVDDWNLF